MFEPEFLDLMPDTVLIASRTGNDGTGYAKGVFGPDVSYRARISLQDEWVRSHDGREIMARGKVYLATTTIPSTRDRITLPSGYVPANPPILDVQPKRDETGVHHVELVIG